MSTIAVEKSPVQFTEFLIHGPCSYIYGVSAADVDRNGKIDLIAPDILDVGGTRKSSLYWFENDGSGSFRRHTIYEGEEGWLERQAVGDLTGNGFPDVVVVNNLLGHIVWFENDGHPGEGHWKRHVITTNMPRAYEVVLADLDGDGQLDVAATGFYSNLVTWYKNPGKSGWDREWKRYVIDDNMPESRTVRAADFNGDGKMDLLCTSVGRMNLQHSTNPAEHGSSIVWYENTGDPESKGWIKHVIDDESRAPTHGQIVDMDGDGKMDFVVALGMRPELSPEETHEVTWYENLGGGQRWKKHHIGKLPYAFEAIAADLDGDGQLEVIASAWAKGDKIVWFKHQGDPKGPWTMFPLKEHWPAANQVIAAALTGSRRLDIIATADDGNKRVEGANELRWWRNDGPAKG